MPAHLTISSLTVSFQSDLFHTNSGGKGVWRSNTNAFGATRTSLELTKEPE